MRLKSLHIQGYKSFANKVEFTFGEGITAVVGPNGSGKSNVADAIRWALGEQSYSTLRGKKTEDMIFSGSDERARLGMAAVTLVLDNTDRWIPLDFSEVTISRRAYRSGENEYHLNGSRVRLRDIGELLAKSGLGRQTYTVIGQGMIDRVLSLNTGERRQLFEEAAGITFHRQKRAETLSRLEETKANLFRLNDIVTEIEPQLKRLKKQADRAEEYIYLQADLEHLLRIWYGYQWGQAQRRLSQATAHLRESEAAVEAQRQESRQIEQEIVAIRSEQAELRGQLGQRHTGHNQLRSQAETVQRDLAVTEERIRQSAAQQTEIDQDLAGLEQNLTAQKQQVAETEAALIAINRNLQEAETARQAARQKLEAQRQQRQTILARQAAAEKEAHRLETALTERQTRLAQFAERSETLADEQQTAQAEIAGLTKRREQLETMRGRLAAELESLENELALLETEQAQQQEALADLNQAAEQLKSQLLSLERREDSLKNRQDWLGKLRSEMSGYYSGVRAVLQPEANLSGIIGPISQIIKVVPDLEVALEMALGSRLQNVVVNRFADAEAAIAYLKRSKQGRATFLPLDTIRPGPPVVAPALPGVIGLASELVEAEPRLQPVVQMSLNRTIVVEDLPAARRVFKAVSGGFQIVTREGELMRSSGAVTGGQSNQNREGTFLAREREWRELPRQIAELNQSHHTLSTRLADNHQQANSLRQELQTRRDKQQQIEAKQQEIQSLIGKTDRELEQITANFGWQQELQTKADTELARLKQRQNQIEEELAALNRDKKAIQEQVEQLTRQTDAFSDDELMAELNRAEANLAAIQSRQKSQQTLLENQQDSRQRLESQIEAKQSRLQTLRTEREALRQQQQELSSRSQNFTVQLERMETEITQAEERLADLEKKHTRLEETEDKMRHRLQWLESDYNRVSLETARRQDELTNLQRQIQDDLGLVNLELSEEQVGQPALPMGSMVSELSVMDELPPGVEEDVKRLRVQVRRLGNINPDAPQEYAELQERHDFLTGQMADLEKAATDLKEIIARLDETMRETFTDTFQKVEKEFGRYFKALFGGGEAQLILTEPDNLVETGVDIVARPPGKRLQSLALLSGGERSLTAQALIFALLRVSPTPFVIFDEVDAMLDEANVGRFRDALTGLAADIQFIIITHNRHTIEVAQTIYGISMGDDSVSQAYSLRLEDWEKQAA